MPLIALWTRRDWRWTLGGAWLLAAAVSVAETRWGQPDVLAAWPNTAVFAALFATGAALAVAGAPLLDRLARTPRPIAAALIAAGLLALSEASLGIFAVTFPGGFVRLAAAGAGAAIVLAFAMTGGRMTTAVLEHPAPRYLGRISYSLYLVHVPVLEVAVRLGEGRLPHLLTIALVPPASILVAHGCRATLEAGSQRLGRHLAERVAGDRRVAEGGFGGAG